MASNVTGLHAKRRQAATADGAIRHDWTRAEAQALYDLPFMDLLFRAQPPVLIDSSRLICTLFGSNDARCIVCALNSRSMNGRS